MIAYKQAVEHWVRSVDTRGVGATGTEQAASDWRLKADKHRWEAALLFRIVPVDCWKLVFRLQQAGMGWQPGVGWRRVEVVSCVQKVRFLWMPWDGLSLNQALPGVAARASPSFQVKVVDCAVYHPIVAGVV